MAAGECKADVTGKCMGHCSWAGKRGDKAVFRDIIFQLCESIGINKEIMRIN